MTGSVTYRLKVCGTQSVNVSLQKLSHEHLGNFRELKYCFAVYGLIVL